MSVRVCNLEAELDTNNVNRVARNSNTIPAAAHEPVGRWPALLEAHLLHLARVGRAVNGTQLVNQSLCG